MAALTDKPKNKRSKAEREAVHLSEIEPGNRRRILEDTRDEAARLMPRRSRTHSDHIFQTRPAKPITTPSMSRAVLRYAERLGSKDDPT